MRLRPCVTVYFLDVKICWNPVVFGLVGALLLPNNQIRFSSQAKVAGVRCQIL